MADELMQALENHKQELINEVIELYRHGQDDKAQALFKRWDERFKAFLSSLNEKELRSYESLTKYGMVKGMYENQYDYFMNNRGNKIIAFIDGFTEEIKKGRYKQPEKSHMNSNNDEKGVSDKNLQPIINMRRYIDKEPEMTTIFIDIVKFSFYKHNERIEKVKLLNSIIMSLIESNKFDAEEGLILIPTGDGMAISMKTDNAELAIDMASKIKKEAVIKDLPIRIGLNKAQDTIIQDINSQVNLCGPGIIGAQRIMDFAHAHEILVSESVYASIADRKGREKFKKSEDADKHGVKWTFYYYH